MEYPIHNIQDYGGRIKFAILQDDPVDFNEIAEVGSKAKSSVAEAVGAESNDEKEGMFSSFNGLVETSFKNRTPKLANPPRQVSMYLCRDIMGTSLNNIGLFFGGRDHTTVMHAVKTVKDKQLSNSQMKRMISTIRKELGFNFL